MDQWRADESLSEYCDRLFGPMEFTQGRSADRDDCGEHEHGDDCDYDDSECREAYEERQAADREYWRMVNGR